MRKYTAKDEEDLIRQIEKDPTLDEGFRKGKLIKGRVVEIRYLGNEEELSEEAKKDLEEARAEIRAGKHHTLAKIKKKPRPVTHSGRCARSDITTAPASLHEQTRRAAKK